MPSSYNNNLRLEMIATGEQSGTWGQTTNNNLGTLIVDAITGLTSITTVTSPYTLTAINGTADQSRAAALQLDTSTGANYIVIVPTVTKLYVVQNLNSTWSVEVKTASGTGITVPPSKTMLLRCNGTNVVEQVNYLGALSLGTDLAVVDGGTGASTASGARTNLGATTIGDNLFTLANPSAITFPRFNADNTVSALDAASFTAAIGAAGGTVTSVSGTGTASGITLSGTVTTSGSLTLSGAVTELSTASGAAPSYSGRAWVNWNGTGTVAIRQSGNVSSITDNATGTYTVNFATAMPDADYALNMTASNDLNSGTSSCGVNSPPTASSCQVKTMIHAAGGTSGGIVDQAYCLVSVFR